MSIISQSLGNKELNSTVKTTPGKYIMTAPNEDSTHIAEDVVNLLEAIERKFPTTIGDDQWYLCAVCP